MEATDTNAKRRGWNVYYIEHRDYIPGCFVPAMHSVTKGIRRSANFVFLNCNAPRENNKTYIYIHPLRLDEFIIGDARLERDNNLQFLLIYVLCFADIVCVKCNKKRLGQ
jgi:hypothetical protein